MTSQCGIALARQFPEPLLEPVDVAPREIVRLLDHPVAADPAAEGSELRGLILNAGAATDFRLVLAARETMAGGVEIRLTLVTPDE